MGLLCPQELRRGDPPADLIAVVGTPGHGAGTFAHADPTGLIREDFQPVAELEFPAARPDALPVRVKVKLPYRVEVSHLYGPVAVPAEAGPGKAKVRLTFEESTEIPVAAGEGEVEVAAGK
jgi:hypothetical protein